MPETKLKNDFLDQSSISQNDDVVLNSNMLQPRMLPHRFRERIETIQRLYLFLLVVFYAIAIGIFAISLLKGFTTDKHIIGSNLEYQYIIAMTVSVVLLFTGAITVQWGKSRKYFFTLYEFITFTLSPIIYIAGFVYLNFTTISDPVQLFFFIGILGLISNLAPTILTIVKCTVLRKKYSPSFKKSLGTVLGNIIIGVSLLGLWFAIKSQSAFKIDLKLIAFTFLPIAAGGVLLILGIILTAHNHLKGEKSPWNSIRLTSVLSTSLIYVVLFVIGIGLAIGTKFEITLIITLAFDVVVVAAIVTYCWFKGRIKNLNSTNPIYNQIFVKSCLAMLAVVGIVTEQLTPKLLELPEYGPISFAILATTAASICISILIAYYFKIITYSKFMLLGSGLMLSALIVILSLIFAISVMNNSVIITKMLANQLVLIFLIFTVVTEVTSFFVDIFYIFFNFLLKKDNTKNNDAKTTVKVEGKRR